MLHENVSLRYSEAIFFQDGIIRIAFYVYMVALYLLWEETGATIQSMQLMSSPKSNTYNYFAAVVRPI